MSSEYRIKPTEKDELWAIYNVVRVGDEITTTTLRTKKLEGLNGKVNKGKKVVTKLTLSITSTEYDNEVNQLRATGRNVVQNDLVALGGYHTFVIELGRLLTIKKDKWEWIDYECLKRAKFSSLSAEMAVILVSCDYCSIHIVGNNQKKTLHRIKPNIPKKNKNFPNKRDSAVSNYFKEIYSYVANFFNFEALKSVVICGPGFTKDNLWKYFEHEMTKSDENSKKILQKKNIFLRIHTSSVRDDAINELFNKKEIVSQIGEAMNAVDMKLMNQFNEYLLIKPEKAFFGYKHVKLAGDAKCIKHLLITDNLFRCNDNDERKRYVNLINKARLNNSKISIFSSLSMAGINLNKFTGIAVILISPMQEPAPSSDEEDYAKYLK